VIVPRTAIGDFVNHDWVACCDRRARRPKKLSGNAIVCRNRVYQGLRRELWQLEIRCVRGRGKRTMPEA
jgi:hypothetical protein